jgi:DNA polymerase-3 subunit epsilon
VQLSFEDLGTPLDTVTFCVLDLETTGGSAESDRITEIGVVKVRGGEVLGTFQTLVDPGRAVPPHIVVLTGITDAMVMRAPRIESVLPTLVEFLGDAVIVGHNIRFDVSFIQAALQRDERPPLGNPTIDTVGLARRLVRDEVPNCKLGTLAERLRLPHRPSHRALDDAWATADLLHLLIERAGRLGVRGLDDLRTLPTLAGHAQAAKLRLTERLPRSPGVYLFRDGGGRVLYVGKATNLRARVRSYFSGDDRRKTGALLRETERIDHKRCATELEARVLEIRLIHHLRPRYNREANRWESQVFVKLSLAERYPRLTVARVVKDDGALYLGPVPSRGAATAAIEAVQTVVALRRCSSRPGRGRRTGPCIPAQLGVSQCPCSGDVDAVAYAALVERVVEGFTRRPALLLEPLSERMERLAAEERYEEAAATRDRLAALSSAISRQRAFDRLRSAERLVVRHADGVALEVRRGRLTRMWVPPDERERALLPPGASIRGRDVEAVPIDPGGPTDGPLPRELSDELRCIDRWLERHAGKLRVELVEGEWAAPIDRLPTFQPVTRQPVPR